MLSNMLFTFDKLAPGGVCTLLRYVMPQKMSKTISLVTTSSISEHARVRFTAQIDKYKCFLKIEIKNRNRLSDRITYLLKGAWGAAETR